MNIFRRFFLTRGILFFPFIRALIPLKVRMSTYSSSSEEKFFGFKVGGGFLMGRGSSTSPSLLHLQGSGNPPFSRTSSLQSSIFQLSLPRLGPSLHSLPSPLQPSSLNAAHDGAQQGFHQHIDSMGDDQTPLLFQAEEMAAGATPLPLPLCKDCECAEGKEFRLSDGTAHDSHRWWKHTCNHPKNKANKHHYFCLDPGWY